MVGRRGEHLLWSKSSGGRACSSAGQRVVGKRRGGTGGTAGARARALSRKRQAGTAAGAAGAASESNQHQCQESESSDECQEFCESSIMCLKSQRQRRGCIKVGSNMLRYSVGRLQRATVAAYPTSVPDTA
eukprot:3859283-Rhodomonas_salina.1